MASVERVSDLEPSVVSVMSRKRSLRVKDPTSACLNQQPKKAVSNVVTALVLKQDEQACKNIIERIQADQIADEYRKELLQKSIAKQRSSFLK